MRIGGRKALLVVFVVSHGKPLTLRLVHPKREATDMQNRACLGHAKP